MIKLSEMLKDSQNDMKVILKQKADMSELLALKDSKIDKNYLKKYA